MSKEIEDHKKDNNFTDYEKSLKGKEKITIEFEREVIEKIILNILSSENGQQILKKCNI
ncbi:MAG TPA: hypothetical protein PKM87_03185 [Methanolinea sp.]|nr:hypothetical protein [Methanolinea sp.]